MLTEKLSREFDSSTRRAGEALLQKGRVHLVASPPRLEFDADVGDARTHRVRIEIEKYSSRWIVHSLCTCPRMANVGLFCEHIWAALLAIEQERQLGLVPSRVILEYMDDGLDELDEIDDYTEAFGPPDSFLSRSGRPPSSWRRPKSRQQPKPPEWSMLLRDLRASPPEYPGSAPTVSGPIEPLYVLDAAHCVSRSAFALCVARWKKTARGTSAKPTRLALKPEDAHNMPDPLDREICLMLMGAAVPGQNYWSYSGSYRSAQSQFLVISEILGDLLPLLFRTGRFYFRTGESARLVPLTWDDGEPWELILSIEKGEKGSHVLVPRIRRGSEQRLLQEADLFLRGTPDVVVQKDVMSRAQVHGCFNWISKLRARPSVPIRPLDRDKLIDELTGMQNCPPVSWPTEWNVVEVTDLAPRPELTLAVKEQSGSSNRKFTEAGVAFYYDSLKVDAGAPGRVLLDKQANRQVRRHLETEEARWNRLLELGMERDPYYPRRLRLRDRQLPGVVYRLLQEGWTVLGGRKLFRRGGDIKIEVTSGIDWFELDGQMDFEGQQVRLPDLLEAARKGEHFVRLGDGSLGMLPEEWLAKHGAMLELGRVEDGHVRFARTQVGLVDALLAEMPEARFDENLAAAREKLHRFSGIALRTAPAAFVGMLRPYQEQGLAWLGFLNEFTWGGCLADDMGLGKTIQVLALLLDRKERGEEGPSLVVAPKSLVFNWMREAERFAPSLRVLDYTGMERKARAARMAEYDLIITTYGTLRRDVQDLRGYVFNYAILDEAQAIKNPSSLNAKSARLLQARQRLVMTGTPVENHLGDLWSLFEFLNPGMLGGVSAFRGAFQNGRPQEEESGRLELLRRMLRPFILRRTKEQVAPELPERSEQTIECVMPPRQASYYQELRDYYRTSLLGRIAKEGLARSKIHVLEALLRLRQAACHPGLIDQSKRSIESAKMEALLPMLEELREEGHKALVFSQFTSLLAILRERLDSAGVTYEYLDGQTADRPQRVDRFQSDPNCRLFLISLKAGGTGLNLTAADYVFILDPWWNPAVEAQAIDRTHRIGQTRSVMAYRLIARDTVEAKVLQLQQSKRDLAAAIITEANSLVQDLTREDLELLLS